MFEKRRQHRTLSIHRRNAAGARGPQGPEDAIGKGSSPAKPTRLGSRRNLRSKD